MGQQGEELFFARPGKQRRQAGKHVTEVSPRVVAVSLARSQQTEVNCRRVAATLTPTEKPVAASNARKRLAEHVLRGRVGWGSSAEIVSA